MKILKGGLFTLCFVLISMLARADIRVASIFQSGMVLQRDTTVAIWGWGSRGENIQLKVGTDKYKGKVDKQGRWKINVGPYAAGGPYSIVVSGRNSIELRDVLFGEVWFCGGQSNMQYTFRMLGQSVDELTLPGNAHIRLFQPELDLDYLPKEDLKGGFWKKASRETLPDFSAVAYHFGKYLYDSLQVPIGLLNINLGATTIETWMSTDALKPFPQFSEVVTHIESTGQSFKQLNEALKTFRIRWDKDHYLKGVGFEQEWYQPALDDSDWQTMTIPNFWEYEGLDHDGAVWFRKQFDLPENFASDSLRINLNQIDDYDITWVNGVQVGASFGNRNWRSYNVAADILKPTGNVLVVRVFDIGGVGGMYSSAFWGNPILLGEWKYKKGLAIDTGKFPVPQVPNGSIFSYPTLLYNGNVAPVTSFVIKGVIWYQGESNAERAAEYANLLPAMISNWRKKWGYKLPFLVVQLANYKQEPRTPGPSSWAELREAQAKAQQLPNVFTATAIDIGEANDIHPKNKEEVGRRLARLALSKSYNYEIAAESPAFSRMTAEGATAVITFDHADGGLYTTDKFGYIRGFQIAGEDKQFYWAKAVLQGNQVHVMSPQVDDPVSVRYGWSDNPGELNLYSRSGLPVLPFRTDNWSLHTAGKVYVNDPHQF